MKRKAVAFYSKERLIESENRMLIRGTGITA
jgi:hypothetical protein